VSPIASDKRVTPRARQLYRLLCKARSNGKGDAVRGLAWPSQAALAKGLGVSSRHVRRLLGELEQDGWIVAYRAGDAVPAFRGDGRSSAYWIRSRDDGSPPADLPTRAAPKPATAGHGGPLDTGQSSGHGALEQPAQTECQSAVTNSTACAGEACFVCGSLLPTRSGPICARCQAEHVRLVNAARRHTLR
jgi:DNA-binding transcriptional MocR family regulator